MRTPLFDFTAIETLMRAPCSPGGPRRFRLPLLGPTGILVIAALLLCSACTPQGPTVDHLGLAKQMAAEIAEKEGTTDYSSSAWEPVAQELQMVPEDSPDRAEAVRWLKEIQQARRAKLFAIHERNGGSVAYKVSATGSTRSRARDAVGFAPPPNRIDVKAIERRVTGRTGASSRSTGSHSASRSRSTKGPVIIYTTSWCGVCKAAKAHLRKRGVSFIEKDVEKDPAAAAEKEALAPGSGVPVISVGGEVLVGYDQAALDAML